MPDVDLAAPQQSHKPAKRKRKATGRPNGRPPGTPQSQEVRDRIAAAKRGQKASTESRLRMSAARYRYLARMQEAQNA